MAISYLIVAVVCIVGAYMVWTHVRDEKPQSWRSQCGNQVIALIALEHLARGMKLSFAWDIDQLFQIFWLAVILWILIAPIFRKPEDNLDGKPNLLRD